MIKLASVRLRSGAELEHLNDLKRKGNELDDPRLPFWRMSCLSIR